jgi:hypothetical protein
VRRRPPLLLFLPFLPACAVASKCPVPASYLCCSSRQWLCLAGWFGPWWRFVIVDATAVGAAAEGEGAAEGTHARSHPASAALAMLSALVCSSACSRLGEVAQLWRLTAPDMAVTLTVQLAAYNKHTAQRSLMQSKSRQSGGSTSNRSGGGAAYGGKEPVWGVGAQQPTVRNCDLPAMKA